MTLLRVCQHPAHEGQPVHKRTYTDTWEGRREHQLIHRHPAAPPPERMRDILTRRQAGQTNARIALDLNIKPSTVSSAVSRLRVRGFLGEAS